MPATASTPVRCDQVRLGRVYRFNVKNSDILIRATVQSFRVTSSILCIEPLEILFDFQSTDDGSSFQYYNYQIDESTLMEEIQD